MGNMITVVIVGPRAADVLERVVAHEADVRLERGDVWGCHEASIAVNR